MASRPNKGSSIINDIYYEPPLLGTVSYKCTDRTWALCQQRISQIRSEKLPKMISGNETSEDEPISTTQTDFPAFSSLLLGYFETHPSKHSCIHLYFIPSPFPSAFTVFFDQRKEVRSQQEGSLPAKREEHPRFHMLTYSFAAYFLFRNETIT